MPFRSTNLAPAFTLTEVKIGILGVRPRLQQRDCPRLTRGSSRHLQWSMSVSGQSVRASRFERVTLAKLATAKPEFVQTKTAVSHAERQRLKNFSKSLRRDAYEL